MAKISVVVLAGTESHSDLGRVLNALELVKEGAQEGDQVELVFDGAGVQWIPELSNPEDDTNTADQQIQPSAEAASITPAEPQGTAPDTTAEAVWGFLEREAYRENWRLWPGKDQLYPGTEPHGMLLTTYTNSTAYQALQDGRVADLPAGSIIVKENWMPDSTFAAATVMYKVDGYDPDHQDWLFGKFDPQGSPEAFGRAAGCQACHQAAEAGYIYTGIER